ncbi:flagellar filament capping protein FliD [Vibrio mimicus]
MSSFDPIDMATKLATYDTKPFKDRYQTEMDRYQKQIKALDKTKSILSEFRAIINSMNNATNGVIKNSATTSQDGFLTASANTNALVGNYQIFVEQVATFHQASAGMPADLKPTTNIPAKGNLELSIGGKKMSLDLSTVDSDGDGKATMNDLVSAINNSSDNPGVNASLVRSNGQTHLMLSSTSTGEANRINISATGTGQAWFEDAFKNLKDISQPKDAVIWLGKQGSGLKLTNSSNTFKGVIDGVDITVSKAQNAGDAPINLSVGSDNESTKKQLDKFVDSYNSIISTLDKYTKSGNEDEARGELANDPTLRSIESQLNNIIRSKFNGKRLSDVGITIGRDGKMSVDNDKFTEAQKNNSAALEAMFNGDNALLDSLNKMTEPFLKFSSGLFSSRKEALQANIDRIEDKQATLERKYQMSYDRYLKQFAQVNTLVNQMNQTMGIFG